MLETKIKSQIKQDPDVIEEIFKRGVAEGSKHTSPSPETLSRLEKLEESLQGLIHSFTEHANNKENKLDCLVESVSVLSKQMDDFKIQFTPIKDYFEKGSFLAKSLITLIKWCAGTMVGVGALAGAWIALWSAFHMFDGKN